MRICSRPRLHFTPTSLQPYRFHTFCRRAMPFIKVDSDDTVFEYLDSGPPKQSNSYRTVVAVHGNSWSASNFLKALSEAPAQNIRLIALNRRAFGKSTPFSDHELTPITPSSSNSGEILGGGYAEHQKFMDDRGREIAYFISRLKEETGQQELILMGWSLGCVYCMKLLDMILQGSLGSMGDELKKCLKGCILYEPPYWSLSFPPPDPSQATYGPQLIASYPPPLKGRVVNEWLGSHFTYPISTASDFDPKQFFLMDLGGNMGKETTIDMMESEGMYGPKEVDLEGRDGTIDADPVRKGGYTPRATASETTITRGIALGVFDASARNVIFGGLETSESSPVEKWFPRLSVLSSANAVWITVYGVWMLERALAERRVRGEGVGLNPRDIRIMRVEGNHFLHWEDPTKFLYYVNELMDDF